MKYLIKSSFKSFFQNKFALILLSIIVFITSATFTMFQSTSNAFDQSYQNVVTQGNLHDFTVKERYPEASEIYVQPSKPTSVEHISVHKQNLKAPHVYQDLDKNIFITHTASINSYTKPLILVNLNDLKPGATKINGKIVYVYRSGFLSFLSGFRGFDIDDHDNKGELGKLLQDNTYKAQDHNHFDILVDDFVADASTTKITINHGSKTGDIKFDFNAFMTDINSYKDFAFQETDGDFNHYSFELSSKSNQLAKDAFANLELKDWSKVDGLSSNDFIVDKKYEGDADEFIHALKPNLDSFKYKTASANLKEILSTKISLGQSQTMKDAVLKKYVDDGTISYKDVKSLYVTSDTNAFRFVNEQEQNPTVDKLKLFSGFGLPQQEDSLKMRERLKKMDPAINDKNIIDKGYTMISNWNKKESIFFASFEIPHAASVYDASSFAAIVSPSYASTNHLKSLSHSQYNQISEKLNTILNDQDHTFLQVKNLLAPYSANTVWVQSTPYLITGVGITPDFSYPIVDASNPIPDSKNQAIIYTNGSGFNRVHDAFRGNTSENYIAVKINKGDKDETIAKINEELKNYMNWPSTVEPARSVNDTNEKIILAPQRITFLQTIKSTVSTISWVTILLLVIFTAFIVGLIVKKKIASRTKQLAILMANGYSKFQISISMMVIGLIVGSISTALGYLVGHWMQFAFIGIFTDYWTLPIWETQFSWISLITTVILPIVGISALAFFISLWQLRGSLISKLNGSSLQTKGRLSNVLIKAASFVGIKTKVAVSIFASNVSKMIMALVAFAMSIIVGSIVFNSFGKFDYALEQSQNKVNYNFQIDLASPTTEAGEYKLLNLENLFQDKNGNAINVKDIYIPIDGQPKLTGQDVSTMLYETSNGFHIDGHPFPHVPTKPDQDGQKNDAYYLKNRIQFKSLLNPFIGLGSMGTSPWSIANKMMPENQRNQADQRFISFINYAKDKAEDSKIPYKFMKKDWYQKLKREGTLDSHDGSGFTSVDSNYLDFVAYGLKNAIEEYTQGNRDVPLPFFITYGNIIADKDDEAYTYIKSNNTYKNFDGKTTKEILMVRGIQDANENGLLANDRFSDIKLSSNSRMALNKANDDYVNNNLVDIVINKYFAKTHDLSVGSTFKSVVENHSNITMGAISTKTTPDVEYKVVSIENSFDEGRVFTSQTVARKVLGWNSQTMFNGLFSRHEDELLFKNLPLYSPSGIYAATDTFTTDAPNSESDHALSNQIAKGGIANKNIDTYKKYIRHYGKSPIVMAYSSVDWATATDFKFHSVLKLSSSLLWMIQSITLFISILFVALISSMIISDNKKFISTLKVLGYRNAEISRIFITTFVPALLIAIVISIPISFGILAGIQAVLIGFGHVLIPLTISGWEIIVATAILIAGFIIVYWASSRELKSTTLLKAFD